MGRSSAKLLALGGSAALIAGLIVPAVATASPAPAATSPASATSTELTARVTPTPRLEPGTIYTAGKYIYDTIMRCLSNTSAGLKCLASDGANIRAVYKKLQDIEKQMETNQKVLNNRFNGVEKLLDDLRKEQYATKLKSLGKNVPLAIYALEALSDCALARSEGKTACQPYLGKANGVREPAEALDAAIKRTQDYFVERVRDMTSNQAATLETLATAFTGTSVGKFEDGLAFVTAKNLLSEQNRGTGASAKATTPTHKTPVVTKWLADKVNAELFYWEQLLSNFGTLYVVKKGLSGKDVTAAQNEVDREIVTGADAVSMIRKKWDLPVMRAGQVLFVDHKTGKIWKVDKDPGLGADLTGELIQTMSQSINRYSSMSKVYTFDSQSFAKDKTLKNRPAYAAHLGYYTVPRLCVGSYCAWSDGGHYAADPVVTNANIMIFSPTSKTRVMGRCWQEINVEDVRPDWNTASGFTYNFGLWNGPNSADFIANAKDWYAQQIVAPLSMTWFKGSYYYGRFKSVDTYGWGLIPSCTTGGLPHASVRERKAADLPTYVGW